MFPDKEWNGLIRQAIARLRAEGRPISNPEMTGWGEAPPPATKTVTEQRWAIRHHNEPDQFWTVAATWAPWGSGTLHRARRERIGYCGMRPRATRTTVARGRLKGPLYGSAACWHDSGRLAPFLHPHLFLIIIAPCSIPSSKPSLRRNVW
jgi:hypothetical protein